MKSVNHETGVEIVAIKNEKIWLHTSSFCITHIHETGRELKEQTLSNRMTQWQQTETDANSDGVKTCSSPAEVIFLGFIVTCDEDDSCMKVLITKNDDKIPKTCFQEPVKL